MAYLNTYNFEFTSNAGLCYRVEIWDQGTFNNWWQGIEGRLGPNAATIKYDSSDADIFASIKPSTLSIHFIVNDLLSAAYISQLRTDRQEKDVYVYMYLTGTSHMVGPMPSTHKPIFAGWLLMDLADDPDVALPFEIKLKAVDGLASLKYYDFIPPSTTANADHLYPVEETWIPDSANSSGTYPTHRTFIDWISKILYYSGYSTTAKGAAQEAQIQTSCNWFNGQMANTSVDPLLVTRCQPITFYTKTGETGNILYRAKSCYDVLVGICKAFGLRCIVYRNRFYFISLSNYENNNSGTLAMPVNINYHRYDMDGTFSTSGDKIDYYWGRYYIPIATTAVNKKLAGTRYNFLPPLKQIEVDFINLSDLNYFDGFPLLPNPLGACPNQGYAEYKNIGVFDFDGITNVTYFCEVWLDFINNSPDGDVEFETRYTISAREVGSTGQWMEWGLFGTATPQWSFVSPSNGIGFEMAAMHILPTGASSINISAPNTFGGGFGHMRKFIQFPTSAFPAGSYQVRFKIAATWNCPAPETYVDGHGGTESINNPAGNGLNMMPEDHLVTYGVSNIVGGVGSCVFARIDSGAIGSNSTTTQIVQSGDDTEFLKIDDVLFGDIPFGGGSLEVYTGSTWVNSGFTGNWGIESLAGTASLAETLAQEILKRRYKTIKKATMRIAMDLDFRQYDGSGNRPMYPMPITRFYTPTHASSGTLNANWIMHTGQFLPVKDEWNFTLYEYETFTTSFTTTNTTNYGGNSGNTGDPGQVPINGGQNAKIGNWTTPLEIGVKNISNIVPTEIARISTSQLLDYTSGTEGSPASQEITSLSVLVMPISLLKEGDTIIVQSQQKGPRNNSSGWETLEYGTLTFIVATDQAADATSISVEAKTIFQSILEGDRISISQPDLISQYQNKTKGTISGMPVTSTDLGPIEYSGGEYNITGCNTTYIKILPRDFMINDDGGYEALEFKDSANSGLQVGDSAQEMIASVDIPYNTKATEVSIWGSSTSRVVEVYVGGVGTNGIGSTIGSGFTDGAPITITATTSTSLNYLLILVKVTNVAHRIYGGKVTLTTIL